MKRKLNFVFDMLNLYAFIQSRLFGSCTEAILMQNKYFVKLYFISVFNRIFSTEIEYLPNYFEKCSSFS